MKWKKGQSGNPTGRVLWSKQFARRIWKETNNLKDFLEIVKNFAMDTSLPASVRMEAITWLSDRVHGKPKIVEEEDAAATRPSVTFILSSSRRPEVKELPAGQSDPDDVAPLS